MAKKVGNLKVKCVELVVHDPLKSVVQVWLKPECRGLRGEWAGEKAKGRPFQKGWLWRQRESRGGREAIESKGAIYLSIYFVSLYLALKMRDWYSGLQEKKEKQPPCTCNDLSDSQKHQAIWRSQTQKTSNGFRLYEILEEARLQQQTADQICQAPGVWVGRLTPNGHQGAIWGVGNARWKQPLLDVLLKCPDLSYHRWVRRLEDSSPQQQNSGFS